MYQLYGYWRSQAAYRVRIALSLKGRDWNEELVDLLKGEQFAGPVAQHNPHHTVPVLIEGTRVLTQSLAISSTWKRSIRTRRCCPAILSCGPGSARSR